MATRRPGIPNIWVTALSKLLSGDASCEWCAWFKAHFVKFEQVKDDFDSVAYKMNHAALVRATRDEFERNGWTVLQEAQNHFKLVNGNAWELAGQPDLILTQGPLALIVDCKTGAPKDAHIAQVKIYMWAIPLAREAFKGTTFDGLLVYPEQRNSISSSEIDRPFVNNLISLLEQIGGDPPCRKVPSFAECRFCKIAKSECPERIENKDDEDAITEYRIGAPQQAKLAKSPFSPPPDQLEYEDFCEFDPFSDVIIPNDADIPQPDGPPTPIGISSGPPGAASFQARIRSLVSRLTEAEKSRDELAAQLRVLSARIAAIEEALLTLPPPAPPF